MWYNNYEWELFHYGVKGMKWGVRRSREELKYNRNSVAASVNRSIKVFKVATKNGILVRGFSEHAADRAAERKVTAQQIVAATQRPMYIDEIRTDSKGRRSQVFIGRKATVSVNPDNGVITTAWKTGKDERRKYLRKR